MSDYNTVINLASDAATEPVGETAAITEVPDKETSQWHEGYTEPSFSGARWELAGQVTLIGMGTIFAVLTVLWAVLAVSKMIFAKKPKAAAKSAPAAPVQSAPAAVSAPTAPVAATANDAELVAILTAAVAAYRAEENPATAPTGFRVVSYRRTNGGRAWNSK